MALLLLAACSSQKPAQRDAPPPAETPEVPYAPRPPPPAAEAPPPGTQVAKAEPASEKEAPPAPQPPPRPRIAPRAEQAFSAAVEASSRGDVVGAERKLKELLDDHPELDYAWTNLAILHERQALPDQAEKAYLKAIELRPDQELAWDYLTRLYCRSGRAAQIESQLRSRIQEYPAALGLRNALVFALIHQGKLPAAGTEAKKVLKADERNVRAMQLLAQVYVREGKNELSRMVLENARAIDDNDAATHNALGLVYLALKFRQPALESFRKAALLKPDFAEARTNFGAMLNEVQDYEAAVVELEAAVNAAPDFLPARLNLGNAYRGKQDFAKAIAQYKQVLRLRPNLPDVYYNLAILHLDSELPNVDPTERFKTAIAYFEDYRKHGGKDERVEQYVKDAHKGIEREERRKEREKRDALKKAERDAAEKKKAEEEAAAKAKQEEEARLAAEKKAAAEAAAKAKREAKEKKAASQAGQPASKLGDEEAPAPAPTSGKLAEDDK